jgi:hypothetical protein
LLFLVALPSKNNVFIEKHRISTGQHPSGLRSQSQIPLASSIFTTKGGGFFDLLRGALLDWGTSEFPGGLRQQGRGVISSSTHFSHCLSRLAQCRLEPTDCTPHSFVSETVRRIRVSATCLESVRLSLLSAALLCQLMEALGLS